MLHMLSHHSHFYLRSDHRIVTSDTGAMGILVGHLLPGALFFVMGLWWTFNIWGSYFRAMQSRRRFQANISFPLRQGSRVPWESILIIVCATAAIVGKSPSVLFPAARDLCLGVLV